MKKLVISTLATIGLVFGLAAMAVSARSSATQRERHPQIRKAINALETAKGDMEAAAHDFCGHKREALEATNRAIEQLRRALEFDKAEILPSEQFNAAAVKASVTTVQRERHPKLKAALDALEAAKNDLEHANHDFGGHRAEAVESINRAIEQLRLAWQCDRQ